MAGWSEPPRRRPDTRNPSPPNLPHAFMEQTSPRRDFAAESAAAQLESTPGRGAAGKRRIRSGGEGGIVGRVKCARTPGASGSPRRFAEIAHTNAKANPTAEAIKKKRRRCGGGGGESGHAPIPIEPNTQQKQPTNHTKRNPAEGERRSLPKNPKKIAADQAGGAPPPITTRRAATNQLTRNNPASPRGANFGTVWARPGRGRQDWIFDGRGEGGPEILADFSSSDFCPAPAHPLAITRIACCILSP